MTTYDSLLLVDEDTELLLAQLLLKTGLGNGLSNVHGHSLRGNDLVSLSHLGNTAEIFTDVSSVGGDLAVGGDNSSCTASGVDVGRGAGDLGVIRALAKNNFVVPADVSRHDD